MKMSGTPGRNVFEHSLSGKLWDGLKKKKPECVSRRKYIGLGKRYVLLLEIAWLSI